MLLGNLQLTNFRNYPEKKFSFSEELTVIIGPNASGKTNLLEAIYLVSRGRSFRAREQREMIRHGEEIARIKAAVAFQRSQQSQPPPNIRHQKNPEKSDLPELCGVQDKPVEANGAEFSELEVVLTVGSVLGKKAPYKKLLVNGVGRRLGDFVGNLAVVLFWPQHLLLVTDSPSLRRRYLDSVLSQVDREYAQALLSYEKALRIRNRLLEEISGKFTGLNPVQKGEEEYWEEVLVKQGKLITKKREEFLNFLNQQKTNLVIAKLLRLLRSYQNSNNGFRVGYRKSEISSESLRRYWEKERLVGKTLVGPHRDDFVIAEIPNPKSEIANELPIYPPARQKVSQQLPKKAKDLSIYGSRGEQRLGVLWLKLGELEFVAEKMGRRPILLLDDIFSELDEEHRRLVRQIIPRQQTIITATDPAFFSEEFLRPAKIIKLS